MHRPEKTCLWLAAAMIFLAGCQGRGLALKIHFSKINGLRTSDHVIYEGNQIGEVADVTYAKQGFYVVHAVIAEKFANTANSHSRFFIGTDPQEPPRKAVEMVNPVKRGEPLKDGATVMGTTRDAVLRDQLWDAFSNSLLDLQRTLGDMTEHLRKVPESEDVKKLQAQLNGLMEDLKQTGTGFQEMFEKEILPQLEERIEELRERLKKFGREKELDPLEKEMREFRRI